MVAFTSGIRGAGVLATGWLCSGAIVVGAVFYSVEITDVARRMLGWSADRTSVQAHEARAPRRPVREVVQIRSGAHGHYLTAIEVNGRALDVMVDTGATMIALTYEDARRAGLSLHDSDFTQRVQTANGVARFAPVQLGRVRLGHIELTNVTAAVAEPGRLTTTLLGMSFLGRLQRVDIQAGVMTLSE